MFQSWPKPRFYLNLCILLSGALGGTMACHQMHFGRSSSKVAQAKPNVLLISIDTLSALHMSTYGYRRATSPAISALAAEGVLFENVKSQSPHTTASHYSIFTGTNPQTHRIVARYDSTGYLRDLPPLSEQIPTLTQYLKGAGYTTHWIATMRDDELDLRRGLARGFDTKTDADLIGTSFGPAKKTMLDRLKAIAGESRPFFAFIHTYIVHSPYCGGIEAARIFNPSYHGSVPIDCNSLFRRAAREFHEDYPSPRHQRQVFTDILDLNSAAGRVQYEALYDGGVRTSDDMVAEIVAQLKASGVYDNTLIVVTSDHGEAFNEHGEYQHISPYREIQTVPLVMKIPGVESTRVSAEALSIDIVPTILDYLRILPHHSMDGLSLRSAVEGRGFRRKGYRYALAEGTGAIWDERWKLISPAGGAQKLYDLQLDPLEERDVEATHSEIATRLKLAMDAARVSIFTQTP